MMYYCKDKNCLYVVRFFPKQVLLLIILDFYVEQRCTYEQTNIYFLSICSVPRNNVIFRTESTCWEGEKQPRDTVS